MKKTRRFVTLLICFLSWLSMTAQPLCHVVRYDEADGVSSAQLLQDEQGFMWFATWNGLCRYDGYDFQTFKPQVGDGCHMTTDRIRNINLLPDNKILCQVDNEYYMFELNSYRFRDLTSEEQGPTEKDLMKYTQSRSLLNREFYEWTDNYATHWRIRSNGTLTYLQDGQEIAYPLTMDFKKLTFVATDNQGDLWAIDYGNIYRFSTCQQPTQRLTIEPRAEVKCLFADGIGHYFVSTKDDKVLRVYSSKDDQLLGYLGPDGRLHQGYTSFSAAVYCMYACKDGTLWLGTKPDGLYRLQPIGDTTYRISHFNDLPNPDIYHIAEDRWGRLWVASLGGGIFYTTEPKAETPHFLMPHHYPKEYGKRARYLFLTRDDILLVATGDGLLAAKLENNAENMRFQRHQREPDRQESLSCSAAMDVAQDQQGRSFIGTESGGINMIEDRNLLAPSLTFRHLRRQFHVQPNDIVQSLTATPEGGLMAVGSHLITLTDSSTQGRVLDARYLNADYRFSEAHPLRLTDGRWLFGLMDGAFMTTMEQLSRQALTPKVVLTYLEVRGGESEKVRGCYGAESLDTLTLLPRERSITIHFAALDFSAPDRISYAFRLSGNDEWTYIGHNHSTTLLDMEPGEYLLEIRSTNADGEWQQNERRLTIIVEPTFWEAWYGQLLIVVLIVGALTAVACTLLYIRRIKRQQRETLEKYLALIDNRGERKEEREEKELDPMIRRVMQFVEENISNSDAGVGEMAQAAAVSRSGLQRKLKQAMGITPLDLMREARINRACQLLTQTDKNISDIAYACGFTDPKYFSRSFRQSTGLSPTEYREKE